MTDLAVFLMDLRGGGAERVMLNLAAGFADRGLNVDLVLVQAVGSYLSDIPSNIRLVNLQKKRLLASLPALIRYLKEHKPNALLSALEDTNVVAIAAKHLAGVNTSVIVTVHNNLSAEVRYAKQLKRRIVPYLIRWIYPAANAVVGVSQGVVQDLLQFGSPAQKTHAIYNPIITSDVLTKLQEPLEHPWFKENQPPVILAVGRLDPQKDFLTLIQAFAKVRQSQRVRLMILGEGAERSQLQTCIHQLGLEQDVLMPGFVANPYAYMAHSAVLVLSSAWEGFGNVLVEAMAAGTPVVSTNCDSGPAEILANGKYGLLVSVGDVPGMATSIMKTLSHRFDPEVLKLRANEFSLKNALVNYQKLLNLSN